MTIIEEQVSLSTVITEQVSHYLKIMKDEQVTSLYDMVLEQVEAPLLQATMEASKFNQSRAAKTLGLSRGTLRTKLRKYFGDRYVGSRDYLDED